MADEFCLKMPDFHVTFIDLLHAVNLRHGTDGFTSPPNEGVLRIFALKNPKASVGFEPANLGTKGQHATSRPPQAPSIYYTHTLFRVIMRQKTSLCIYRCVNLMNGKQCSLLHVSATYCGRLQGGVTFYVIHPHEHLPEYGHNRWPKHGAGYAIYHPLNLNIFIHTRSSCLS